MQSQSDVESVSKNWFACVHSGRYSRGMQAEDSPRLRMLRMLLVMDATVLFLLGALFMIVPKQIELAFHFQNLPDGVSYLIGLWGCVFATMAMGYGIAAASRLRTCCCIRGQNLERKSMLRGKRGSSRHGVSCLPALHCVALLPR